MMNPVRGFFPQSLIVVLLFFLASFISPTCAEQEVLIHSKQYDDKWLGRLPKHSFKTTHLDAYRLNLVRRDKRCQHDLLTFLAPRGFIELSKPPQASIYDSDGHLVWTTNWRGTKNIYNLAVQQYRGNDYLTFWAGNDAVGGHGEGTYFMLDQSYNVFKEIDASNGFRGDLHEFRITEQGTAILTSYQSHQFDVSSFKGKSTGPVWDCIAQEVHLETGEVIFEWRASDHLDLHDSYQNVGREAERDLAWDWYHMNSVNKDSNGDYIISARYTHTVTKVDGKTGEVIWVLGGKRNSFKDLSHGQATNFAFQHDARWDNNFTEITLFDNTRDWGGGNARGKRIRIDQEAMTAELVTSYDATLHNMPATSQGSFQSLPNGNVLLGYGSVGAWAEFTHEGELLCETHFGPRRGFGSGDVQSYRVQKHAWKGFPTTNPDLAVSRDDGDIWRAYVSWNGATEVDRWVLQGAHAADAPEESWVVIEVKQKRRFEDSFVIPMEHARILRVKALDSNAKLLGTSTPTDAAEAVVDHQVSSDEPEVFIETYDYSLSGTSSIILLILFIGATAFVLAITCKPLRSAISSWRAGYVRSRSSLGQYFQIPTSEIPIFQTADEGRRIKPM
ncbi:Arylsulfotransferase-domain-containing protein [Xylariomycetidae sp. FL2044]|nr:Arylsulfotransferase-domain-containing protein [Xylariomycetidae sp. FL2044]